MSFGLELYHEILEKNENIFLSCLDLSLTNVQIRWGVLCLFLFVRLFVFLAM